MWGLGGWGAGARGLKTFEQRDREWESYTTLRRGEYVLTTRLMNIKYAVQRYVGTPEEEKEEEGRDRI